MLWDLLLNRDGSFLLLHVSDTESLRWKSACKISLYTDTRGPPIILMTGMSFGVFGGFSVGDLFIQPKGSYVRLCLKSWVIQVVPHESFHPNCGNSPSSSFVQDHPLFRSSLRPGYRSPLEPREFLLRSLDFTSTGYKSVLPVRKFRVSQSAPGMGFPSLQPIPSGEPSVRDFPDCRLLTDDWYECRGPCSTRNFPFRFPT